MKDTDCIKYATCTNYHTYMYVYVPYCPGQAPMDIFAAQAPKLKMGSCTEEMLEWFHYPRASTHCVCEGFGGT